MRWRSRRPWPRTCSTGVPDQDLLPTLGAGAGQVDRAGHPEQLPRGPGAARARRAAARGLALPAAAARRRRRRDGRARPRDPHGAARGGPGRGRAPLLPAPASTCSRRCPSRSSGCRSTTRASTPKRSPRPCTRPVAAVVLQPRAQNPTGVTTTRRRAEPAGRPARAGRDAGDRGRLRPRPLPDPGAQPGRVAPGPDGAHPQLLQVLRPRPAPRRDERPPGAACAPSTVVATWARAGAAGCSSGSWSGCSRSPRRWRRSSGPAGVRPAAAPPAGRARRPQCPRRQDPRASTCGSRSRTRRRPWSAWPARGSASAPGRRSPRCRSPQGHVRLTCGLVVDGHDELAERIADAAQTVRWGARAR